MTDQPPNPTASRTRRSLQACRTIVWALLFVGVVSLGLALLASWLVPVVTRPPVEVWPARWTTAAFFIRVFQFHVGLACLVAGVAAITNRRWRLAAASAGVWIPVLAAEATLYFPSHRDTPDGPTLRLAAANLYFYNRDIDAIEAFIRDVRPDVLVLVEFSGYHRPLLERLADALPHQAMLSRHGSGLVMILSATPVSKVMRYDGGGIVTLDFDRSPLDVAGLHHRSPAGVRTVMYNFGHVHELLDSLTARGGEAVALGDFNATTWSPQASLLQAAGLTDGHRAAGMGRGATWPNYLPRAPYLAPVIRSLPGIRIDKAYVTPGLRVIGAGVGPYVGSDHRPIWVDVRRVR